MLPERAPCQEETAVTRTFQFWIPGPLPGLNEALGACRQSRGKGSAYSQLKKVWTHAVKGDVRAYVSVPLSFHRADFNFLWHELRVGRKRGRDPDNVHHGAKYIFDGLVAAGVLKDDTAEYVGRVTHEPLVFVGTPGEVGVLVTMTEVEG